MSRSLGLAVGIERIGTAQHERSQHLRGRSVGADEPSSARDCPRDLRIDGHLDARMTAGHGRSVYPLTDPLSDRIEKAAVFHGADRSCVIVAVRCAGSVSRRTDRSRTRKRQSRPPRRRPAATTIRAGRGLRAGGRGAAGAATRPRPGATTSGTLAQHDQGSTTEREPGAAQPVVAHRLDCVVLMNAARVRVTGLYRQLAEGIEREAGTSR